MPERSNETTRVVIASDLFLTREGVACLLSTVKGVDVVARVARHADILAAVRQHSPDVVVVSIRAGRVATEDTLDTAARLRDEHPEIGVVVIALEGDHFALELLRRGSRGRAFLLDDRITDVSILLAAIAQAKKGQAAIEPAILDVLVRRRQGSKLDELTLRELDVLTEMAKGFSNRVVADTLSISVKAVERHVTSIFRKLDNIDPKRFDRRVAAVISYVDAFGTPKNLDE